jgi:ketosteroid isomerase-like protein
MAESNVDLARRGFDAALRGDLDTIAEMLDAGVKWHGGDPTAEGSCQNRDQALSFIRQSQVVGGGRVELVDVIGAGDKVVVILRPSVAGGEPARAVANLTTFRDGKVVEMVHYLAVEDALAAAGAEHFPRTCVRRAPGATAMNGPPRSEQLVLRAVSRSRPRV